eukprot:XP_003969164.1 PREDICTED: membrane progestin receptor alpha-B-like [Takifugu rubripes]
MASVVLERTGRLFISLQQIQEFPRMLTQAAPSMPGTVRDTEVPHYFRQSFVFTGYRPLHQHWRYYFLSIFQRHNETINIWTHLLALFIFLFKLLQLSAEVDFVRDPHSWPLLVLLVSSLTYTACSVAAHLLAGKSELCHYTFYFLDYVGVAQYQFGSAVVHFYYSVDEDLHRQVQGIFMPVAMVFSCLSCLGCCYGKYCNHDQPTLLHKAGQLIPSVLAFLWDISPIAKRLMFPADSQDPAAIYHLSQVVLSLSTTFFFTVPVLESCFPGWCDFMGQSHQLFHVCISCFTLSQIHSAHLDFMGRRKLYSRLHQSREAALFARLYVANSVLCVLVVAFMLRKVRQMLDQKSKSK